ncbi:hypothetical protein SAMN05192533_102292 [Mesobacillus persicus]|uniref:Uncharacterized protein n=1 Tax=Mesobacillus persicus TaxID=930146 RepID=A0A1H7XQ64_9BACI|nr:hypothetical protein [Mesobacillus persicus]SEM35348.1 hypothetical protein SAMN05192533_102292 [Mesobacillus persicus]
MKRYFKKIIVFTKEDLERKKSMLDELEFQYEERTEEHELIGGEMVVRKTTYELLVFLYEE